MCVLCLGCHIGGRFLDYPAYGLAPFFFFLSNPAIGQPDGQ
jgi:hypothetical protein